MPGLLSWFTSWLDSASDSDDQILTDLNVAVNNTILTSRAELGELLDSHLNMAIIKLHYAADIEPTLARFLALIEFQRGDLSTIRRRLQSCASLNTLALHDEQWETHSTQDCVDTMLSVLRSWIKLDVCDGEVQQALLIIAEDLKSSLTKAVQAPNSMLRIGIRVPTLNTICLLLIQTDGSKLHYLATRVTLFDEFSNDEDCQQIAQVLNKLDANHLQQKAEMF